MNAASYLWPPAVLMCAAVQGGAEHWVLFPGPWFRAQYPEPCWDTGTDGEWKEACACFKCRGQREEYYPRACSPSPSSWGAYVAPAAECAP